MMSLLEKAKKLAKEADDQKKREADNEIAASKFRQESLESLSKAALAGLKELHNAKTNNGTLKLVKKRPGSTGITIANLRLTDRPNQLEDVELLFIDASIKSGSRSYGEGCEDIAYTEATVEIYVKNPPTSERFGYAQTKNWQVSSLGLATHFHEYVTHWNEKELPKKLEKVAEWLAPLFRE
jgi:hypothetical protein